MSLAPDEANRIQCPPPQTRSGGAPIRQAVRAGARGIYARGPGPAPRVSSHRTTTGSTASPQGELAPSALGERPGKRRECNKIALGRGYNAPGLDARGCVSWWRCSPARSLTRALRDADMQRCENHLKIRPSSRQNQGVVPGLQIGIALYTTPTSTDNGVFGVAAPVVGLWQ